MDNKKIKIAIVDDHTLFRSGLASLMEELEEIEVLFEAQNGIDLQAKITQYEHVEVVLMDINMPIMDGYTTTRWIKINYPHIHVLVVSMFEDEKVIIKMLKSGVSGYVPKESKPMDLLIAIKTIMEKGFYVNELISGRIFSSFGQDKQETTFKDKELAFLQLCCSDLTYPQIADKMNVGHRTVDNYREALFRKLKVKTRIALVVRGIKNGMIKI